MALGELVAKAFLDDDIEGYFDALDTEIYFKIVGAGINLASKNPVASFFQMQDIIFFKKEDTQMEIQQFLLE